MAESVNTVEFLDVPPELSELELWSSELNSTLFRWLKSLKKEGGDTGFQRLEVFHALCSPDSIVQNWMSILGIDSLISLYLCLSGLR